jgi:hypothetical protein
MRIQALSATAGVVTVMVALAAMNAPAAQLPGPSSITPGVMDDWAFEYPWESESDRALWFSRARQIGATWIRITAYWVDIAPSTLRSGFNPTNPADPNYDWKYLDSAIRLAAANHQKILLTLTQAPTWGEARGAPRSAPPGAWRPNARAFGQFARAAAARYSGRFPDPLGAGKPLPQIRYFQAWNEPNFPTLLAPQWIRGPHGGWIPASPAIYRALLNAAYKNIKAVQRHAKVIAAGTAPYGDPPGGARMTPVRFISELLCLRGNSLRRERCPHRAHLDGLDHHPYASSPTYSAHDPENASVVDLGRLIRIMRTAVRRHTVLPAGRKSMWATEFDWSSNPPDPNGIPLTVQARYLSLSFYELWRQGVTHMFWFLLRDRPYKSLTGAGLYFVSGQPKPAAAAFGFPFAVVGVGHGRFALWGRSPKRGFVQIQRLRANRWESLLRAPTTRGGIFYVRRHLSPRLVLRAYAAGAASRPWVMGPARR